MWTLGQNISVFPPQRKKPKCLRLKWNYAKTFLVFWRIVWLFAVVVAIAICATARLVSIIEFTRSTKVGLLHQKQTRKHNRQIQKCLILKGGVRKLNQSPYLVKGFRLFDKVKCLGQVGFIFGRRASGYFDVRTLGGKKLSPAIHAKKLILLERRRTFLTELRKENGASSPV